MKESWNKFEIICNKVTVTTLTSPPQTGLSEVGERASVDELSGDLLQGTEGLLKLEAFGDGLLLSSQGLLLWGGGLAALAKSVGGHDYQLLCQRATLFLLSCAAGKFRTTGGATAGAGWLQVLHCKDLLHWLSFLTVWRLKPGVFETLPRCGSIPEWSHTNTQLSNP